MRLTANLVVVMNVANESRLELLRTKAQMLVRENQRLTSELLSSKRRILELEGRTPEELQQELALLDEQIARENEKLEEQARKAEEQAERGDKPKKPRKKRSKFGNREQPQLEVVPEVLDLDDADKHCAECGGDLGLFDDQDDVTEEVDVVERRFIIKKRIRKKYRCRCGCIEMAELPARLVPGGRYSNEFALEVATLKYVDQMPLERIARTFGREGLVIDSQTLWDQVAALAKALRPAWQRLRLEILRQDVVGLDQTWWKVIGHKKTWQMWELSIPTAAFFTIVETKGKSDGESILDGYAGYVMCDAASTHGALAKTLPIKLAYCWAHVVRMAREATPSDPGRCEVLRTFLRDLYDVDKEAERDLERLRELRATRSEDTLKRMHIWLLEQRVLPSSPFAKVRNYIQNQRAGLWRFLDDPRIPLDNSLTERGYLWPAIGRRSFTGSRSQRGTEAAALFYSLFETCRRCDKDPKVYLRAALTAALEGRQIPLPFELQ